MSTYSEALKDPRWARRRLEVLVRAEWTCEECRVAPEEWDTLNVHHRYYRSGAKPWEYEDTELVCLCRRCHEDVTDELERVYRAVGMLRLAALPQIVALARRLAVVEFPPRLPEVQEPEDDD